METSLILGVLMTLVLGLFEFGRLMMALNLLDYAARDGCRYALANNTSSTISSSVQTLVTTDMAGLASGFSNFTVTVSGTHAGVATAVNNLAAGDTISVTVSGAYKLMGVVPVSALPKSLALSSTVTMACEGGN